MLKETMYTAPVLLLNIGKDICVGQPKGIRVSLGFEPHQTQSFHLHNPSEAEALAIMCCALPPPLLPLCMYSYVLSPAGPGQAIRQPGLEKEGDRELFSS